MANELFKKHFKGWTPYPNLGTPIMDKINAWSKLFESRSDKEQGKTWWTLVSEVMNKNDDCSIPLKSSFPEISDEYLPVKYLWGALFEISQRLDALGNILVPTPLPDKGALLGPPIIDEYSDTAREISRANELSVNYCCKLWSQDSKERVLAMIGQSHGDGSVQDMEVQKVYSAYLDGYLQGKNEKGQE